MTTVFSLAAIRATAIRPADIPADVPADILGISARFRTLLAEFLPWAEANSLTVLAGFAASLLFYTVMVAVRGRVRRHLARHPEDPGTWTRVGQNIVARTRSYFLITLAFFVMTRLLGAPPAWQVLIGFLFTIGAVVQGAAWVRALLTSLLERRLVLSGNDASISSATGVMTMLINIIVWALAAVILLDNLGVNVTALIAGLGIGGIAIGLAAQGIFSDLFAALSILIDQPFRKGESIQIGGEVSGTVEAIGMKTTRIRAQSGEMVVMSNANLLNQRIHNYASLEQRYVTMSLQLTYQIPPEAMEAIPGILREIVTAVPDCRFDSGFFSKFDSSSINFDLAFYVDRPEFLVMLDRRQQVAFAICRRFAELGAEFAYPTRTLFMAQPARPAP